MTEIESALRSLTIAIQPARRAWVEVVESVLSESGLSLQLGIVILLLLRLGSYVRQKALLAELDLHPGTLDRILGQGEAAGLLARRSSLSNRRSKTVELLSPGRALAERLESAITALRSEVLRDVSLRDIDAASRVLRALELRSLTYLSGKRVKTGKVGARL